MSPADVCHSAFAWWIGPSVGSVADSRALWTTLRGGVRATGEGPRVAAFGTGQAFSFWSKRCIWAGAIGRNTRLADCSRLVAIGQLSIANDCCLPKQSLRQSFHGDLLQSSKLSPAYDPFRMATLHLLKWCYRSGAVILYRGFSAGEQSVIWRGPLCVHSTLCGHAVACRYRPRLTSGAG